MDFPIFENKSSPHERIQREDTKMVKKEGELDDIIIYNFLNLKIFHEFSNFRKIYIYFFFFCTRRGGNRFDKRNRVKSFTKKKNIFCALPKIFSHFFASLDDNRSKGERLEKGVGRKITGVSSTKIFIVENFWQRNGSKSETFLCLLENENRAPIARIFPLRFHFQRLARVARCRISKK